MWKAIFQIKLTIYRVNLQSYTHKIIKCRRLRGVTLAGLAKKYPKNGGVRKANRKAHEKHFET